MGTPNRHDRVTEPIRAKVSRSWLSRSASELAVLAGLSAYAWVRRTSEPPTAPQLAGLVTGITPGTIARALTRLCGGERPLVTRSRTWNRRPYTYALTPGAIRARGWEWAPAELLAGPPEHLRTWLALATTLGNQSRAARRLGVTRRAVVATVQRLRAAGIPCDWSDDPRRTATRGGENSDDTRNADGVGTETTPIRARVPNRPDSLLTYGRSSNAGEPAQCAPSDGRTNGNPERQPRTAPVMETTEGNRTASRRTRDGQHRNERPTLEPLPATAQRWIVRAGFGGYRFRSEAERDFVGAFALDVCRDQRVRQPHAVIAGLLRDCRRDPDAVAVFGPDRAARLEWSALKRGVDVRRNPGGGLYRRVACVRCGPSVVFRAPFDSAGHCPLCGLGEGDDPSRVPDWRAQSEDAKVAYELTSGLARAVSVIDPAPTVEDEEARRERLIAQARAHLSATTPPPPERPIPPGEIDELMALARRRVGAVQGVA